MHTGGYEQGLSIGGSNIIFQFFTFELYNGLLKMLLIKNKKRETPKVSYEAKR